MAVLSMVRVTNLGDKDFIDSYNSQRFVVEAGKSAFVPYDAAVIWFGNPAAVNTDREPGRNQEFERVQQRYAAYGDVDSEGKPGAWERNKPKMKIETTEGEELTFVMDDPQGERINTATFRSELTEDERREAQIASMEKSMQLMQDQINSLMSQREQGTVDSIPTDDPDDPPALTPPDPSATLATLGPISSVQVREDAP